MKRDSPGTDETAQREPRWQGSALSGPRPLASPDVDIYEGPDELLLIADVPGVSGDGLTVSLSEAGLTIEGKRVDRGAPEGKVIVAESSFADFERSFVLPHGVSPEGIWAEVADGVLRVHMPKAAASQPRSIAVKAR